MNGEETGLGPENNRIGTLTSQLNNRVPGYTERFEE